MASASPIIELAAVSKHYPARGRGRRAWIKAVDGVSLAIGEGRTLGVVGESGCGKSTTLRLILGIEPPTHGEVRFEGRALDRLDGEARRRYRRSVQAVFQDPWGSLNPRMRVGMIVAEPLIVTGTLPRAAAFAAVRDLLAQVGLQPSHAERFPHEFSGGQRQRIAVARALALSPRLVVLDEPVSALDVSIRAQIINLLKDLQEERGLAYLFVAHQLSSVWSISDEVAVMYLGRIVETAPAELVRSQPLHPYTQALLRATLPAHPRERRTGPIIAGEVPSPIDPPSGCSFHPRCPRAMPRCAAAEPTLRDLGDGRSVACHLY